MTREWRSPIPYAGALVGAGIGVVALGLVGLVVGAEVCEECHDFDFRWVLAGAGVGATAGGIAGAQAGVWAVRRGSRAAAAAAAVLGFLLVGAAGAWAATDLWQRTHPTYDLRPALPCRRSAEARPKWCYGQLGHQRARRVPRENESATPPATAAGGILAGCGGLGSGSGAAGPKRSPRSSGGGARCTMNGEPEAPNS